MSKHSFKAERSVRKEGHGAMVTSRSSANRGPARRLGLLATASATKLHPAFADRPHDIAVDGFDPLALLGPHCLCLGAGEGPIMFRGQ